MKNQKKPPYKLTKKLFFNYFPHWKGLPKRDPIQLNIAYNEWKRQRQGHI